MRGTVNKLRQTIMVLLSGLAILSCGCSESDSGNRSNANGGKVAGGDVTQLNISVLLDLSDRIKDVSTLPPARERDIELVGSLINIFKENMERKGAYRSNDKIRILFDPIPKYSEINSLAKRLNVDLSKLDSKGKKDVFDHIDGDFREALGEIYDTALRDKNWVGLDVWRFFRRNAKELCIDQSGNYRNILVIVTDGYIYHAQSRDRIGNKTAYITELFFQREGFRNTPNRRKKFDSQDYGFIFSGETYENLEIMVMEVNPSQQHKNDEEIIRAFIDKWFEEMQVRNYVIHNVDLPGNTKQRIENFFGI